MAVVGLAVTPLTASDVAQRVLDAARSSAGLTVGNLNLHGAYVYHTDTDFRQYCASCDVVLIDGAPIAWLARTPMKYRVGSTDWLDALLPQADDLRVVAIGGTPTASHATQLHMRTTFPSVKWHGADGYSNQRVDEALAALIRDADIVLVGMGMPLQEKWILRHRHLLADKVVANVGGCLDYYGGTQSLAPRWLGAVGLEWLYRLGKSPRRLARRYLWEPILLAVLLIRRRNSMFR